MSTAAFFSDSLSVLQRTVEVKGQAASPDEIIDHYEIERCADFIKKNGFKKVALQFPDDLLQDSAAIAGVVQSLTSAIVFILGDTSYGSCCVDEVAAQHGGADAIIHFGPACLSTTKRTPVLYVFGHGKLNVEDCCQRLVSLIPDQNQNILVVSDVMYTHKQDEIQARLQVDYQNAVFSSVAATEMLPAPRKHQEVTVTEFKCECNSGKCCSKGQSSQESKMTSDPSQDSQSDSRPGTDTGQSKSNDQPRTSESEETVTNDDGRMSETYFGRKLNLKANTSVKDYVVFYIGSESRTLTNLMLTFNRCTFYTYDPVTSVGRQETLNVNRALMRRYHLIEKAKDANIVGIVAGTLGVANYMDIISHLKKLMKRAGKKSYVFVVGKLNVAKLANFLEVDAYVLVACPENSLIDSKEFYRPVVTPFEMEIACNEAREWTGEYIADFQQLLPGASSHVELPASSSSSSERTDVSLITGNLRSLGTREEDAKDPMTSESGALVKRDETLTVSNVHRNASEFLSGRSWQGLEQKLGETPVTKATEGRKGIASSYTHEQM